MAKWGEGDPRWLVEHREDGKNVNGWHWEEKGRLSWSKERLAELLRFDCGCVRFMGASEVTGEAMQTTRKGGKVFALYDLKITVPWELDEQAAGAEGPSTAVVKGTLMITDFASTSTPDEYSFDVSVSTVADDVAGYKALVSSAQAEVMKRLGQYAEELSQLRSRRAVFWEQRKDVH